MVLDAIGRNHCNSGRRNDHSRLAEYGDMGRRNTRRGQLAHIRLGLSDLGVGSEGLKLECCVRFNAVTGRLI
jgi:hypothetical protein